MKKHSEAKARATRAACFIGSPSSNFKVAMLAGMLVFLFVLSNAEETATKAPPGMGGSSKERAAHGLLTYNSGDQRGDFLPGAGL